MGDGRILDIGNNLNAKVSVSDVLKKQNEVSGVMFSDMITMGMSSETEHKSFEVKSAEVNEQSETVNEAYEKYQYNDHSRKTESKQGSKVDGNEVKEELKSFAKKVTEALKEALNVTDEEIVEAMEMLGLQFIDLMDLSNLSNLVVSLGGSENVTQLICNESFMNTFQEITVLGKEVLDKLDLSLDELKEMEPEDENEVMFEVVDERTENEPTEKIKRQEQTSNNEMEQNAFKESDLNQNEVNPKEETLDNHFDQKGTIQQVFTQHVADTVENKFENVEVKSLPTYVSVTDIMEQFVEQTRVTLTADITKMEMQLHPEHLGKLYLEVTENQGTVTAKIQTQNAVVKEALEVQIADLRQNLNQAGVKVDAIEVTVASHEFEQNLEQGENRNGQEENAASKQNRNHSIRLDSLMDDMGDLSEEEALVAKMMVEQGNSVDLTA